MWQERVSWPEEKRKNREQFQGRPQGKDTESEVKVDQWFIEAAPEK